MYDVASKWLGHMRGGLALSTVTACGGMAAISGSSMATAATMTKVAVPAMRRYKYDDAFSAGTVAAGGTIGILIPPSGALIIYGLLSETNIAHLFMAGIIPGIISILLYVVAIQVVCLIKPEWAPRADRATWRARLIGLKDIWGIAALFLLIMGGIFFGVFTASEGGGVGAGGALLIAILRKKMSPRIFLDSLKEAAMLTATVFSVGFGALMLNQFVNIAGAPAEILAFINSLGLTPWGVIAVILCCFVVLGTIVDGPAMIFLTVPIFVPVVAELNLGMDPAYQLVWWGIIMVVVISSMLPDVPLMKIYKGITAFFIADLIRLAMFVNFPGIVLWLVKWMG